LITKESKYCLIAIVFIVITGACSTEKDAFVNRKYHSTTTKYNVLYNGNLALEAGLQELSLMPDNFWEILPIEPMQTIEPVFGQDSIPRNSNFVRAEDKAVKAIEKHSMNVGGVERNPEMSQSYLLLGKARYYDQRFIPAMEAFNFILYKYPDSKNVDELKFWKEKTNIRLDNNTIAIHNLNKILENLLNKNSIEKDILLNSDKKVKNNQLIADITATIAQAYLNEEQYDNAITNLTIAKNQTSKNNEKARYSFILGQLLEKQGSKEEAVSVFNQIIKMNFQSPREYVVHSQAKIISLEIQDSLVFNKKIKKLLNDRENRPFLDVINHQIGLHYDKLEQDDRAISFYNQSLKYKTNDWYRVASNYRNIAEIHFYDAKYSLAGKYYDSTLTNLKDKTKEFKNIKRKRENLEDVIKYEAIATKNDSILMLVNFSEEERIAFFEKHIQKYRKERERLKKEAEKTNWQDTGYADTQPKSSLDNDRLSNISRVEALHNERLAQRIEPSSLNMENRPNTNSANNFYFYNPTTIASGKNEFRKRWGNRTLKDYWRLSNYTGSSLPLTDENQESEQIDAQESIVEKKKKEEDPRLTSEFYISKIPTDKTEIENIQKERNFAYYQLGMIYKEKFKEYELARSKFEDLLESDPEERLILPAMYNLYRIYEILNSNKKIDIKAKMNFKYPDSRYTQLINNPNSVRSLEGLADQTYNSMFAIYENGDYKTLLVEIEPLIEQYSGEEIISKLELLKASAIGNLQGLNEYKKALNYVALTYPNSTEGKEAEELLKTTISKLEKLNFGKKSSSMSWKIIHKTNDQTDLTKLNEKLEKFISERPEKLKITLDNYTENEKFVTIHNISSQQKAKDLVAILEDHKDYKIDEKFVPVSSEDYKVIQVKKNFEEYLRTINKIIP